MTGQVRRAWQSALFVLALFLAAGHPVAAQSPFAVVAKVNDRIVTRYELDQRIQFFTLLRAPGDLRQLALDRLIEERLYQDAAKENGVTVSNDQIAAGMDEFAARANLSRDDFLKAIGEAGVDPETFRDFVYAGILWREVVRKRFGSISNPTDTEIDWGLSQAAPGNEPRVLLSEILLPAGTPESRAASLDRARAIRAEVKGIDEFAEMARRVSASGTRASGGELSWLKMSNLPPEVAGQVAGLQPGQITQPIEQENVIALFQLRERDVPVGGDTGVPTVEYATFAVSGPEALARVRARAQVCDDLYGLVSAGSAANLSFQTSPLSRVPQPVAAAISTLDAGEIASVAGGSTAVMLCNRTKGINLEAARNEVRASLINEDLGQQANLYLGQLRSRAIITLK